MGLDKILVLEDEALLRKTLEEHLRRKRFTVAGVDLVARAEDMLSRDDFDLVFLDMNLPDGDGTKLLERMAPQSGGPLFVVVTGNGTIESAVACMRAGAFDYVIKPFSLSQIDVILRKAESFDQLVKVNQFFTQEAGGDSELVGESPPMRGLRQLIGKVAPTEATVLISGENGTGKELVARELFRRSNRANQPYIRVNCAAVSETIVESEFFGHEKGAFTGALQRREGRFELANNGTILLDEISEISTRLQAKLLRVLQEREFERVGGNKTIKVNVRVIATTNRDLHRAVQRGEFREDLYYRLNVFPVQVAPLRQRPEDIPVLVQYFLDRFGRKHGVRVKGITEDAMQLLLSQDWPGNVRELQNTIERGVILSESGAPLRASALALMPVHASSPAETPSVGPLDMPLSAPAPVNAMPPPRGEQLEFSVANSTEATAPGTPSLAELEKQHILMVLAQTGGNRTHAAKVLEVSSRTLRNKLALYRKEGAVFAGED